MLFRPGIRDNISMWKLQLFTTAELARMRDRTASRNHSPARDQFRREHEQHRAWGLKRRHAERLRHARSHPRDPAATPTTAPPRIPHCNHDQVAVNDPNTTPRAISAPHPQPQENEPTPHDPNISTPGTLSETEINHVPRKCTLRNCFEGIEKAFPGASRNTSRLAADRARAAPSAVGDDHQPSCGRIADRTRRRYESQQPVTPVDAGLGPAHLHPVARYGSCRPPPGIDAKIRAACQNIPQTERVDIRHPQAIYAPDTGRRITDAQSPKRSIPRLPVPGMRSPPG